MHSFLENLFVKYDMTAFPIYSQALEKTKEEKEEKTKQKDN